MEFIVLHEDIHEDTLEVSRTKLVDRQLLIASREFATEHRRESWWHWVSTLLVLLVFGCVAGWTELPWLRGLGSLLFGLTLVRTFIVYHDYQHQSIFKGSRVAGFILSIYGCLMLTPPSVWKRSHDHHHRHNSKLFGACMGSFPIMTTSSYRAATSLRLRDIASCLRLKLWDTEQDCFVTFAGVKV